MRQETKEAAAAAGVDGARAVANLAVLHGRLRPCFARVQPFDQAKKYVTGLISDLPPKNEWTNAEHAGDASPDRIQRLLNHAVWDHDQAQGVVRRYVAEQLGDQTLRVAALDESGQEKAGTATAGVQRQYMGCAGRAGQGNYESSWKTTRSATSCVVLAAQEAAGVMGELVSGVGA